MSYDEKKWQRFGVPDPDLVEVPGQNQKPERSLSQNAMANSQDKFSDSQTDKRKWGIPQVDDAFGKVRPTPPDLDARTWAPKGDSADISQDNDADHAAHGIFTWLWNSPILISFTTLAISIGILFLFNQLLAFIRLVESSPFPFRIAGWSVLGLLCLTFLYSVSQLWWTFRRLRTSPGIAIDSSQSIYFHRRSWIDQRLDSTQISSVLSILRGYPRNPDQRRLLARGQLLYEEFEENIDYLIRENILHDRDWLMQCKALYVEPLRKCSNQIVHDYAMRVALKTAIIPNKLLDILIICINSIFLFEELCRVFNVRTNRIDSIVLVSNFIFTTMISAKVTDFIDQTSEFMPHHGPGGVSEYQAPADHMIQNGSSSFVDALSSAGAKSVEAVVSYATANVVPKVAEGTINYILFRKLGHAAIRSLLPIR